MLRGKGVIGENGCYRWSNTYVFAAGLIFKDDHEAPAQLPHLTLNLTRNVHILWPSVLQEVARSHCLKIISEAGIKPSCTA